MNTQQPSNLRQRLKTLLAIPDSQRTEAQWEEIIELEITLAPGNRESAPMPGTQRKPQPASAQAKPGGGQGKKPFKKFHKRPPKAPPT
jgi:hypothetical protein